MSCLGEPLPLPQGSSAQTQEPDIRLSLCRWWSSTASEPGRTTMPAERLCAHAWQSWPSGWSLQLCRATCQPSCASCSPCCGTTAGRCALLAGSPACLLVRHWPAMPRLELGVWRSDATQPEA